MPASFERPAWQAYEDEILFKFLGTHTPRQIAEMLPFRTAKAVQSRLRHLRVEERRRGRWDWSPQEDDVLRAHHATLSAAAIAVKLPGRTVKGVKARLRLLQIQAAPRTKGSLWTPEQDAVVLATASMKVAAEILGRTARACESRRLVLRRGRAVETGEDESAPLPAFTPADELDLLRQEYPGQSYRNYRIPSEGINARRFSAPLGFSPTGSSMAMCVGTV
jgi:hypothetical protein